MTSDPAFCRMVAEKVLGLKFHDDILKAPNGSYLVGSGLSVMVCIEGRAFSNPFRPDVDANDAMLVLNHVAGKKHWHYCIFSNDGLDSGPQVFVEIYHGPKCGKNLMGEGDDLIIGENNKV